MESRAPSELGLLALCLAALAGCSGQGSRLHPSGVATAQLELAPTGVACIVLQAVGSTTVTQAFGVVPQGNSVFALEGLSLGNNTFTAASYSVPCANSGGTTPTYVSNSVVATVTADVPVHVTLQMNDGAGEGTVRVAFSNATLAPSGVACLLVQVAGASTVTFPFDVAPQSATVFALLGLPLGSDTFSAQAFSEPCAQSGGASASWTSGGVSASVNGGLPASVTLSMTEMPSTLSLSPPEASVMAGGSATGFTATLSGSSGSIVWTLSGPGSLSAEAGATTSYTPPASVQAATTATLTATSGSLTANAAIFISPPITVSVTPAAQTLPPNGTQQFAANVTGTANTAVTWSIDEGSPAGGSVSQSGFYTAPGQAGAYHVRATSVADTSASGVATVSVRAATVTWAAVSAGSANTLAVKTDGTLWTWGHDGAGELGNGTTSSQPNPTPLQIGTGYASVAGGNVFDAAVKTDGTLWAWGDNAYGQLGNGTTTNSDVPVLVGTGFASVSAGYSHTVAVKTDGTLWAWGDNSDGQLGDGTLTQHTAPEQIGTDNTWASVSAGGFWTAAIKKDGTLWTWGLLAHGDLGNGTANGASQTSPGQIGTGYASVSAGWLFGLAVKTDKTLWAWGYNAYGQLGDGTTSDKSSPEQVGTGYASAAASGAEFFSLAVTTSGQLWAWGNNAFGTLGNGTTTSSPLPLLVGTGYASVTAGNTFVLAIQGDGSLWAWGENSVGELGIGTTSNQEVPVEVSP